MVYKNAHYARTICSMYDQSDLGNSTFIIIRLASQKVPDAF